LFGVVNTKYQVPRSATGCDAKICRRTAANDIVCGANITNRSSVVLPLRVRARGSVENGSSYVSGSYLRSGKNRPIKRQRTPARRNLAAVEVQDTIGCPR
jgi:hypothetical protein